MSGEPSHSGRDEDRGGEIRARDEVARELAKVPGLRYDVSQQRIRIEPMHDDGFPIELLARDNGEYAVFFAVWHEEFSDEESALDCFFFGLCEDCRLEVTSRGKSDFRWTMQALQAGEWRSYSTTGLLVFPFWRRKGVRFLQNRILKPPDTLSEKFPETPIS